MLLYSYLNYVIYAKNFSNLRGYIYFLLIGSHGMLQLSWQLSSFPVFA